jgi:glycerol-3-phosphate dehydrogenase (NAD(P)+)
VRVASDARTIAVIGAGAWGTALAIQVARTGRRALLWGRRRETVEFMSAQRCNPTYLPEIKYPDNVQPHWDLGSTLAQTPALVIAVPSVAFRDTLRSIAAHAQRDLALLWATKGLEAGSGRLLHEVADEELGRRACKGLLSGPSFAAEVARELPTAVTVAAKSIEFARHAASWFHSDTFRVYTSVDVVGVQLGGALKNVLAIAAGISDGLGFGANARAALITRGLNEMTRLSERAGARRETLMGLSGLGDLVLTCTDDQSRNRRLGLALGRGQTPGSAAQEIGHTVEGIATAGVVLQVARSHRVEMPICEQVCRVLAGELDPRAAVTELLRRERKMEKL